MDIINELETREGFAQMLNELFAFSGATNRGVARLLEVNEKTVRNWLEGYSQPDPSTLTKLFRLLGIHMEPWLKARHATPVEESENEKNRREILQYVEEMASPQDLRYLNFLLNGRHGSSTSSVLIEIAANMSCTMRHKYQIASMVNGNYSFDEAQGKLIFAVAPEDLERFRHAIALGKEAAINGENAYTQIW